MSDYLSEALRELRKHSYADVATQEFGFGSHLNARDEKAVRKTVSGLLKLLHPDQRWTRADLREYLEFALEGRQRVKKQLKFLASHEYAKVSFSYVEVDSCREVFVETLENPEGVGATEARELRAEERVIEYAADLPVEDLVKLPEGQTLEFKSSMRHDISTNGINKALEQVVVKSVAGMMNADGGILLIGVADDGEIVGVEKDVRMLPKRQDTDGYENHLTTLLENGLGAAAATKIGVRFDRLGQSTVCRIVVQRSSSPVWTKIKGQEDTFYVRLGNSTRPFGPRDAYEYISQHYR